MPKNKYQQVNLLVHVHLKIIFGLLTFWVFVLKCIVCDIQCMYM